MEPVTWPTHTLVAPAALVMDLLAWLAARPRTYRETMDAWRTSCPRMPVWEDAVDHGLVEVLRGEAAGAQEAVRLTTKGRAWLDGGGI
jgi:hypothetical protein